MRSEAPAQLAPITIQPNRLWSYLKKLLPPLALYALALALNVWRLGSYPPELHSDEPEYDLLARQLNGPCGFCLSYNLDARTAYGLSEEAWGMRYFLRDTVTAWRQPIFPYFLSRIYRYITDELPKVRLTLTVILLLVVPLLYCAGRALGLSPPAALAAAALWVAFQNTQTYLPTLHAEILAATFALACVLFTWLGERSNSLVLLALGGAAAGTAALTRGYLLPLVPLLFLWLLARRSWRAAIVGLIPAVLMLSLWAVRNQARLGVLTLSTEGWQTVWQGNGPFAVDGLWPQKWEPQHRYLNERYPGFDSLDEVGRDRIFRQAAIEEITSHPLKLLTSAPGKLFAFIQPRLGLRATRLPGDRDYALGLALLPAICGAALWWRAGRRADVVLLLLPLAAAAISCVATFGSPRFRTPGEFALALLAAVALERAFRYGRTFLCHRFSERPRGSTIRREVRMLKPGLALLPLLLCCLATDAPCVGAQSPAADKAQQRRSEAQPEGESVKIETNEVLLPVTVRDAAGQFVPNLRVEDFTVFEDGVPQQITSFALRRLPVSVVLLIDTSSSVTKELEDFKAAALSFAAALDPNDRLSLIRFDDKVELVLDWTTSRAALKRALNRLSTGLFTQFNDALYLAAKEQLRHVTGRKAIIVLTDGVDSGRGYTSAEAALRAVIEAEAPVYVVSKTLIQRESERREMTYYENASNSVYNRIKLDGLRLSLAALDASERRLARLAEETGGRLFLPRSFDELGDVYRQVADELRSQYAIFYTPQNAARDGSYRAVRVKIRQPSYHVTSRLGYYAR